MTDIKTKPKTHRPNASRKPLTPEEAVRESVGIRWVAGTSIAGRPTLHDLFDYITQRGPAIDCNCERCADWKARFAAGAGAVAPWRASQALAQAADEMKQVRQELELAAAEGESEAAETSRVLKQALDALELVMQESVGDGIQVRQRIGSELSYGIDHAIRALREQIALLADGAPDLAPVRDIRLPDGTVRHNVGSDNLSDEDREAMVLTDDQVAALNEDERRNGAYGAAPTPPAGGPHPSHTTRISMDASSYDEICTKCGAPDIAGGGWGRLAQPCPVGEPESVEVDTSGTPEDSANQPAGDTTPESGASETAASQSGVMAALFDNVRNAGHKWTFGVPSSKQKTG